MAHHVNMGSAQISVWSELSCTLLGSRQTERFRNYEQSPRTWTPCGGKPS